MEESDMIVSVTSMDYPRLHDMLIAVGMVPTQINRDQRGLPIEVTFHAPALNQSVVVVVDYRYYVEVIDTTWRIVK
jgi:hypothetical protein